MSNRLQPTNLFALDPNTNHRDPTIIVIEAFVPLVLAVHGGFFLLWLGRAQPWQWLVLGGLLGLGLLRLGRGYAIVPLPAAGYATYIFLAGGLLIASTGGAASPFALWTSVLVAVYPLVLRTLHAWLLPPLVATGYLLLSLLEQQPSLPFVIICSWAFLLCFIGWLTCLLGISLQRRTQSYWQAAEQLAKEQRLLRAQIDFNQAVLDSLSAHIAVLDQAGTIIAVNQAWRRFAAWNGGTPAETGVGVNYLAVCANATGDSAAEAATIAARIQDVIAGRMDHFSLEYPCHSPSEQHWFLFNVVVRLDGEGAVVSHTNITKRKAAEAAVRQNEARNRALVEAVPDAILRIHRDGAYLDIKAPHDFMMVRPISELIGKKQHEVLPTTVADRVIDYNLRALATGELQTFEYELVVNGEQRIRESRVVPVATDEVIAIVRDVTEQRQTQESLRRERDFAQSLVETAQAIILVLDTEGRIVRFNPYMTEISGYQLEEVKGKDWFATCLPTRDRQQMRALFAQALARIPTRANISVLVTKAGHELAIEWYDKTLKDANGQTIGLLAIGQDVTARRETERRLQASEAYNRALLAAIPDSIARLDRDGVYLDIQAPRNFDLATPAPIMLGKKAINFLPPDVAQQLMLAIERALTTREMQTFEYQVMFNDRLQTREVRLVPHTKDEVITITRDITARRITEEALHKSEARHRALLEAIPDGMARLHRDGTYLDIKASPDFVPPHLIESLIGKRVQETIEPQLAQRLLTVAQQALDKGEIQLFEFEIQVGEARKIREGRVVPAGTDEVICILRDITARKQAEKVLRQSEERYRTLAELSPDAILVNVDGRYVYANSAAARIFGVKDAQNLIGRASFDFLVPEEHDLIHERMRQIAGGKWPEPLKEGRVRRLDGVVVHVEVAVAPFTWNDQPSVLIIVRDITARKQSEAEKSRLHAEVDQQNTHLRALTVRLAEVQEEERKALARELHDQVGQNLSTLGLHLKIMQNQLAVAPPHTEPIPVLLNDMQGLIKQTTEQVRNVMAELRPPMLDDYGLPAALEWYANRVAKQGNFTAQIEAAEEMPRLPAAVENGLFRITQEAMINIMKHAQATVVMLKIAADEQVVALAIADNGRGIDPTVLATQRESWGLLSMRERTESLGGCFTLNSQPGQGTTIQIVIPYGHSP